MNRSARLALRIGLICLIGIAVGLAVWGALRLATAGSGSSDNDEPKDPDAVRMEEIRRIRDLATLAKEAAGPKVEVARTAVEAMSHIGPVAAPEIRKVMRDSRPEVREAAVVALGRVSAHVPPPADMAALAEASREDEAEKVRAGAVTALGGMYAFEELETLLSRMLDDESVDVRRRAAAAVIRIIGEDVGFKADGSLPERRQAIERIRAVWREHGQRIRTYYTALRKQRSRG